MRRAALSLVCVGALALPGAARGGGTADIAQETLRSHREEGRIVNFWWLPPEYWVAAAREVEKSRAEIAVIEDLFADYLLIAALDVVVKPDARVDALSTAEIVRRLEIRVDGREAGVLREVDPQLQELVPGLVYVLQTSLGRLGSGLHLLPLPNLDRDARPIATGARPVRIEIRYRASAARDPIELEWRGPLTSVAGPRACPKGGEPLEASWSFCPWHGVPVDGAAGDQPSNTTSN